MFKKILSVILSLSMIMSICTLPANAWIPTDYDNPKCIDIRQLGKENQRISIPKNVCGCKKCSVDAFTYSHLEQYVKDQRNYLENLDNDIKFKTQIAINQSAGKHFCFNLVLISSTLYGKLGHLIGPYVPIAAAVIMSGSTIVGLYLWYRQQANELIVFENKIKQQNIYTALKNLSNEIEDKIYKDRNFILVSKNNDPSNQGAAGQFGFKEGLKYNETKYNSEYFDNINDKMIKPLLTKIEADTFRSYKAEEYQTQIRDAMKKGYYITVPSSTFSAAYNLYNAYKDEILKYLLKNQITNKILEFAKEHKLSKENVKILLKFINEITENSDNDIMKSVNSLSKTITILLDDKEKSNNDTNALTQINKEVSLKNEDNKINIKIPNITISDLVPQATPAA